MLERRKFIVNSVASLTLAASTVAFAQNRGDQCQALGLERRRNQGSRR